MLKRAATTLVVLLAALAAMSTVAAAKKTPHPTKVSHCPKGYVIKHHRVHVMRHGHKVWVRHARCVHKAKVKVTPKPKPTPTPQPAPSPSPTISYKANVDPSFTQAAGNALAVTYDYSADASETVSGQTFNLAAQDQLPSGVLNFYSSTTPGGPEQLYCSMNVADATSGGDCPITYSTTGTYSVTTQYIPSGASAVTETDSETITPFSTTTTLTATEGACGVSTSTDLPPGLSQDYSYFTGPYCTYTLTTNSTDQNNNPTSGNLFLLAANPYTGQPSAAQITAGSCTVYVNANHIVSPDCAGITIGTGLEPMSSWSVTASYSGSTGWSASTSQAVTLTP